MRSKIRRPKTLLAATVAALVVAAMPSAAARPVQDPPETIEVFTYSFAGGAAAIAGSFDVKGFLALSPILAFGVPRVTMGLDPTPASSARAAPIDPGVVGAADAAGPALLGIPPGLIPPFPLYADANFPQGQPEAEVGLRQEVPGAGIPLLGVVNGRSSAAQDVATADATVAGLTLGGGDEATAALGDRLAEILGAPAPEGAFIDVGSADAAGQLKHEDRALSGFAESRLGDLSLFGGLLQVQGVEARVELDWPDPTQDPVVKATSDVGSIRLLGLPAAFGPDGELSLLGPLGRLLNPAVLAAFDDAGIHIRSGVADVQDGQVTTSAIEILYDHPTSEIPGVLGSEQPNIPLRLGTASMTYTGELVSFPVPPTPSFPDGGSGPVAPAPAAGGTSFDVGGTPGTGNSSPPASPPAASDAGSAAQPTAAEPTLLQQILGQGAGGRLPRGVLLTLLTAMTALFTVASGRFRLFSTQT